ncbi:MAG: hypothetical protein ACR2FU_00050 [Streptosporangiaceae bacterium]
MTVTGAVAAGELGVVLPHEHVFIDLVREYRGSGLLNDEHLACQELAALRAAGGATLVDLTPDEIGRDPAALRRVSAATGISIVMGCGHYRDPYLDRGWFDKTAVDAGLTGVEGPARRRRRSWLACGPVSFSGDRLACAGPPDPSIRLAKHPATSVRRVAERQAGSGDAHARRPARTGCVQRRSAGEVPPHEVHELTGVGEADIAS